MEAEHFLIVLACVLHLIPVLVSDAVIDVGEFHLREEAREGVCGLGFWTVARKEDASVVALLDQSVGCVAVCADSGRTHAAVVIAKTVGCAYRVCSC